jgi:hypothetical protein
VPRNSTGTAAFRDIQVKRFLPTYGDPIQLFDGKSLAGWAFSSDRQKNTWSVKDGVIRDSGKPAGYLRTTGDYTHYVLRVQMRHLTRGNSGVLVRMVGPDKVWPRSIEAQGMYGNMGDIFNIDKFPMKSDPARTSGRRIRKLHLSSERPLGEWNLYEITLDGGTLEIRVNGRLQNRAKECWETPGKICLQAEGAQLEFRNLTLIPIVRTRAPSRP